MLRFPTLILHWHFDNLQNSCRLLFILYSFIMDKSGDLNNMSPRNSEDPSENSSNNAPEADLQGIP